MSIINPFMKPRGNRKVVFVGASKSSDTLLRYVGEEQIPARCEGLRKRDSEFEVWDGATVVILKRATKHSIVTEINFMFCVIGKEEIPARSESITKRDGEFEAWDASTQSCKLMCGIKSTGRRKCYGVKSKEGSSSSSTSIFKKKIE
ncbi:PATL3 [Linum grandiflorum]